MSAATEFGWRTDDLRKGPKTELAPLFENAPLYIAQVHREGTITALNPALQQIAVRASKPVRLLDLSDLFAPQDRAAAEPLLKELFDGERDSFRLDAHCLSDRSTPFRWTAWRVQANDNGEDYVLAFGESVKADPETEQRLRQAQRLEAVGRLAGGVAHDFNNLLTGVLLYCDLLLASVESGNRIRKYAEEIRNAGMQATGLVRQLLSLSRPVNYEPRLLSLNEVVEGMRNLLVRLIGENIELKLHLDPHLGLIKMDLTQAQQILLNLVLNSRDAMPTGGKITVETSCCKVQIFAESSTDHAPASLPCVLFAVCDTGTGMDERTRTHLFEAFFTTKSNKGTGLGLATVHDIVTSNGGLIHVDSTPGKGTRFSVLLPIAPEGAENLPHIHAEERTEDALLLTEKE